MAKARTTAATTVEEPIVEQNVETTAVVEEPQTVSEEPQTVSEEGGNNETTTEGTDTNTPEGDNNSGNTPQTPAEADNDGTTTEPSLEDKFVEMTGINKPYAKGIMNLPNFDYYIPVGSGVNLTERNNLITEIKDKNKPTETV
jgi:hypothetical protein